MKVFGCEVVPSEAAPVMELRLVGTRRMVSVDLAAGTLREAGVDDRREVVGQLRKRFDREMQAMTNRAFRGFTS